MNQNFPFLVVKFSIYLNRRVFKMIRQDVSCGYPLEPPLWRNKQNIFWYFSYIELCNSRHFHHLIQLTLVISTLLISNNRLSRSEKSGPNFNMEIYKYLKQYCGKEKSNFSSFQDIFNISLASGSNYVHLWNVVARFIFSFLYFPNMSRYGYL